MDSKQVREKFKDFFEKKEHLIVASDSMVIKNDPTLMFTNAGMNQFKDVFLGISEAKSLRVADSQKCLRVSGKHNDLEDVGHDTYHHTMFEMLGNWSFGDYFKDLAIDFAWELLTEVYKVDKDRLYITVFGGDANIGMDKDTEAEDLWIKYVPKDRIIYGSRKDNFWEMGDAGPCGPCSEIHIDLRDNEERQKLDGASLVNEDHPEVIEIWNLVFIQYNHKADGSFELLPKKHIDTGMGFERLCAVLQGKKSNYDIDLFQTIILKITEISGKEYGKDNKTDIALRVIADHLRAVSFAIADGQLPSNVKAGYVIRRILRRAVRYAYSFLDLKEAFLYKLVETLSDLMGEAFPELISQKKLIEKVIQEEETTFLKTLDKGIRLLESVTSKLTLDGKSQISGADAFILYDTYGFPLDLTELIAKENGFSIDVMGFEVEMEKQKTRARNAAETSTDDWIELIKINNVEFVGYDSLSADVKISKYRKVKQNKGEHYQIVFNKTPFYAESGGQVGDSGYFFNSNEKIDIINTIKEHSLIIHIANALPINLEADFVAKVNADDRIATANNHSATHLLHYALRKVLGDYVEQKGSLVDSKKLRFDFSYFSKLTDQEIRQVEIIVNSLILDNINKEERRDLPINEAVDMGAMALFGEKYGDLVRVIKFAESIELCGGTHVDKTGQIGFFKIVSESAIAAGVRRIEAITSKTSQDYVFNKLDTISAISTLYNNPKDLISSVESTLLENAELKKKLNTYLMSELKNIKTDLLQKAEVFNGVTLISEVLNVSSVNDLKEISAQIRAQLDDFACVLACVVDDKPYLLIAFSNSLVESKSLNAGKLINQSARIINGGGGGQAFVATAGGKDASKISEALKFAINEIKSLL